MCRRSLPDMQSMFYIDCVLPIRWIFSLENTLDYWMDTCKAMYLCLFKVTARKHLSRKSCQNCLLEQKLPENLQVEYILFGNLNFLKKIFCPFHTYEYFVYSCLVWKEQDLFFNQIKEGTIFPNKRAWLGYALVYSLCIITFNCRTVM